MFFRCGKSLWDVLSRVSKYDIGCFVQGGSNATEIWHGMFCPGMCCLAPIFYCSKYAFFDTDTYTLNKDVCQFLAYCVTEFEAVFRGLIFWRFLFIK